MVSNILYGIFIFVHIIVSIVLILVILLQAGRGGGLSESFGSSAAENIFGAKTPLVLVRVTTICAILYFFTCLGLAILTAHRGRSLVSGKSQVPPIHAQGTEPTPLADVPFEY